MQQPRIRPTGITVLVILEVIGSIIALIGGVALVTLSGFVKDLISQFVGEIPGGVPSSTIVALASGIVTAIGVGMIILALIGFVIAWGLWTGRGWAWTVALIFAILGILIGIVNLIGSPFGIVPVIINGIIAFYLWRSHVKAYFGKAPKPAPVQKMYCPNCGYENPLDANFCRNCGSKLVQ